MNRAKYTKKACPTPCFVSQMLLIVMTIMLYVLGEKRKLLVWWYVKEL